MACKALIKLGVSCTLFSFFDDFHELAAIYLWLCKGINEHYTVNKKLLLEVAHFKKVLSFYNLKDESIISQTPYKNHYLEFSLDKSSWSELDNLLNFLFSVNPSEIKLHHISITKSYENGYFPLFYSILNERFSLSN